MFYYSNNLNQLVNKNYCDLKFETLSGMINYVNRSTDQNISGVKTFYQFLFVLLLQPPIFN